MLVAVSITETLLSDFIRDVLEGARTTGGEQMTKNLSPKCAPSQHDVIVDRDRPCAKALVAGFSSQVGGVCKQMLNSLKCIREKLFGTCMLTLHNSAPRLWFCFEPTEIRPIPLVNSLIHVSPGRLFNACLTASNFFQNALAFTALSGEKPGTSEPRQCTEHGR